MKRKTEEKMTLLWNCITAFCLRVMSEGTGNREKIIISDGENEVRFTPAEFDALKGAIKKGEM